jgi:aryl-alcohol dehydrogenase-like predicted oxidoreductase
MTPKSTDPMCRRDFLTATTAATVAGVIPGPAVAVPADAEWRNKQSGMTYRRLGNTGLMVSSMGMGGNTIRPDNSDHVLWAIDNGLNYLDTSPTYGRGRSEEGYAGVLKARGRENVFLTSKVSDELTRDRPAYRRIFDSLPATEQAAYRNRVREQLDQSQADKRDYLGLYFRGQDKTLRDDVLHNLLAEKYADRIEREIGYKEAIIDSVEQSLKRLGTDYLDCLLCPHGVDTPYETSNHPEIFEAFEVLKKQGKVRFFGFSAHTDPAGVLNAAVKTGMYSMAMIAYNFLNHSYVDKALNDARQAGMGVMAMKASRPLENPYRRATLVKSRVATLGKVMPEDDLTPHQRAFKWALKNEHLSGVVAGIVNMDMAKQDVPLAITA